MLIQILQSGVMLPNSFAHTMHLAGHLSQSFETVADLKHSTMASYSNVVLLVLGDPDIALADIWSIADQFPQKAIVVLKDDTCSKSNADLLNVGADDCVHIHSCPSEIFARITSIVCRKHGHATPTFNLFGMEVNLISRMAKYNGGVIPFKDYEFRVVEQYALRNCSVLPTCTFEQLTGMPSKADREGHKGPSIKSFQRKIRSLTCGGVLVTSISGVGISIISNPRRHDGSHSQYKAQSLPVDCL